MATFDLIMPKLGESIQEATITKWFIKVGDSVQEDDPLLEIATDKVDSEIPSPVAGVVEEILFAENELVEVGRVIARIQMNGGTTQNTNLTEQNIVNKPGKQAESTSENTIQNNVIKSSNRFYSPLVKNIAQRENIPFHELEKLVGSGSNNRVTKNDLVKYIQSRGKEPVIKPTLTDEKPRIEQVAKSTKINIPVGPEDNVVEMDRVRRLIADHMVHSKHVAPHVTAMVEADVTNIVKWREKLKSEFEAREKEKLTYLPVFLLAMAKALKDFPGINASVDGYQIIYRKNIHIGVAVALENGNLIVPVIKNADRLNLLGMVKELNRLAKAARENKLKPDEISGGTFSVSNFGSFKNVMGTPIINQPEVAIMAVGTVEKKPAVIETPEGDAIAIRHKMFLSLTYDHRVVDGALGGAFLRKVADYIEGFSDEKLMAAL
jgi:2-oxoglutarate dehydrogenase E2 component (dihydrolipoamide succinyltransferase)